MKERDRLLAAIAADPDAIENWIVYADWLAERDDPRGELINLELAIETGAASDEIVERHRALVRDEDALLSPRLAEHAHHLALKLRRGFIDKALVFGPADDPPTPDVIAALFDDPHACMLHTLDLREHPTLFVGSKSESVRELYMLASDPDELPLADGFPMLRVLAFGRSYAAAPDGPHDPVRAALERLAHPRLSELRGTCPALATGHFDLPGLTSLHAGFDLVALLAPRSILTNPPPLLSELTLSSASPELVRELGATPLCAQLRTLTLLVDAAIIETLARDPAPFAHIEVIGSGFVQTIAQRDELVASIDGRLPRARFEIHAAEGTPAPRPDPPSKPAPELAGVGDALARFAQRLRDRS